MVEDTTFIDRRGVQLRTELQQDRWLSQLGSLSALGRSGIVEDYGFSCVVSPDISTSTSGGDVMALYVAPPDNSGSTDDISAEEMVKRRANIGLLRKLGFAMGEEYPFPIMQQWQEIEMPGTTRYMFTSPTRNGRVFLIRIINTRPNGQQEYTQRIGRAVTPGSLIAKLNPGRLALRAKIIDKSG